MGDSIFNDFIFRGADTEGLVDANEELINFLFGNELKMDAATNNLIDENRLLDGAGTVVNGTNSKHQQTSFSEQNIKYTDEEKKFRIVYAMRDSINISTFDFAMLYNPTNSNSKKGHILFKVMDETVLVSCHTCKDIYHPLLAPCSLTYSFPCSAWERKD